GDTGKLFAIGLGCEARHADRTIYSRGFNLLDLSTATPSGSGCRVCTRDNCAQRAFPSVHKRLDIDAHDSTVAPYERAGRHPGASRRPPVRTPPPLADEESAPVGRISDRRYPRTVHR